ncbi:MAG: ribbon-helix-helix protein, CopG family [Rhodobacteraceae bacterium]|nr:ribbon-helix-helix protein, CopG family [Paracoccaceae bacterium]
MAAFSSEERQALRRLVAEGKSRDEVAAALGRSGPAVARLYQAARQPEATTRGHTVTVRLTTAEMEALQALAAERGRSKNAVMRSALRQGAAMVEIDREVIAALRDVRNQIAAIGRNLNQLTELANADRLKGNPGDARTIAKALAAADLATGAATRVIEAARAKVNILPWDEGEDET